MHVFELLELTKLKPAPVMAVLGSDRFLQMLAIRQIEKLLVGEGEGTTLDGESADWRDIADELDSGLLFAQTSHRLIIVDPADSALSSYRDRIEQLCEQPSARATLLLVIDKLATNTRLSGKLTKQGVRFECNEPTKEWKNRKIADPGKSIAWLIHWAQQRHGRTLARPAAKRLWEQVGPIYGLLDQELAKLALYTDNRIDEKLVQQHCGSWRTQTTWQMIDAALDGNTSAAIMQLEQLLIAGEAPPALLGQLAWSLRRYATAARLYELAERRGQRMSLKDAIKQSGFRWQKEIELAERRLRRMGRPRALKLPSDLVRLDVQLKSSHSQDSRARQALELFLLSL